MIGDNRAWVAKLDRPVLVTCQTMMRPFCADLIKSTIPSARVELFDDAGHALFVDAANRFNSMVDDFLDHLPRLSVALVREPQQAGRK
jgi:non-heme chloroperoxidase